MNIALAHLAWGGGFQISCLREALPQLIFPAAEALRIVEVYEICFGAQSSLTWHVSQGSQPSSSGIMGLIYSPPFVWDGAQDRVQRVPNMVSFPGTDHSQTYIALARLLHLVPCTICYSALLRIQRASWNSTQNILQQCIAEQDQY